MALTPASITASILAAGPTMTGVNFPVVASAVGNALYSWIVNPANFFMSGVTAGTMGAGVVVGNLIIVPNPAIILAGLSSFGVVGTTAPMLAAPIASGIASILSSSGQYTGPSVGVAVGSDNSFSAFSNPTTLASLILFLIGTGPTASQVSSGLALGISNMLVTMTGIGAVTGAPVNGPSTGTSPTSVVF